MLQGAGISFRPVKGAPRRGATGSRSEFPISEEGKLELRKVLAEAFVDELLYQQYVQLYLFIVIL